MTLLVLVLPSSCIKEDVDDCDNVTIYFQYLADGDTDVLYQYMKKIDLYVFDEGGQLRGVNHYNEDELKNFSEKSSFKLTPGQKYKVVAVGNAYERTEVVNLTTRSKFDEIYLQHPSWGSEEEVDGHDHNYIGQKEFFIPNGEFIVYRDTVTLHSAHVNVEVEINGLPAPENGRAGEDMPYKLMFEHSNAQTDFEGNVNAADEAKGTCYPNLIYDYERNCYRTDDLCLFRMNNPEGDIHESYCGHELVLVNTQTGEEMIRSDVYNYIKAHEDDFDLTLEEATLPISINFIETTVEIKLPQWYVEDIEPDWN